MCLVLVVGTMSRVSVPCHVKGTVALQVGDVRTSQGRPGVLVIDVTFPSVAPFEVSKPCGRDPGSWAGPIWGTRACPRHLIFY